MPSIGLPELLVVLMILLVVFGGARLPQIGDALGRAARSLKRGFSSDDRIEVSPPEPQAERKSRAQPAAHPEGEIADADIVEKKS